MNYYEVFAAETRYQKREPLTYEFNGKLHPGQIIMVPYGKRLATGFIVRQVEKPAFATKSIEQISELTLPTSSTKLHSWMLDFYHYGSGAITQLFLPSDIIKPSEPAKPKSVAPVDLPALTKPQAKALDQINSTGNTFLLHGETGSGKTRIYLELAKRNLSKGRSVIILTPEISLTPQLVDSFLKTFGNKVLTIHSGLSKAVKRRSWQRALTSNEPLIVIGTRSALFTPLKNIGLIVVDEMHEPAYKQDSSPRYYALRVAAAASKIHGAKTIYGSATPSITDYYLASNKKTPIIRITETAIKSQPVTKTIIDLKDLSQFGRDRYLSEQLIKAIEARLNRHEQSLLFLNRRGTARQIICKQCGWQALCSRCDLPLVFHADSHNLRCHTCGLTQSPPYSCPECQASDLTYRSLGTKALADNLARLFPEARIARFDTDNLVAESLERNFDKVRSGEIDIIIGTQMLGKGLDLPHLSLVGIINADTSLTMPDFSSAERNYQLLHQAIGRVGRGHKASEVIIQSFRPDDPLLKAAVNQDWQKLYEIELRERQSFLFPPFCFLLKLSTARASAESAEAQLLKLKRLVADMKLPISAEDPTPSFYERSHGKYNWQLIIKSKDRSHLIKIMEQLPPGDYTADIDPLNLL